MVSLKSFNQILFNYKHQNLSYFFQQSLFILRFRFAGQFVSRLRKLWLTAGGMKVGTNTKLPKLFISWPHQVSIGSNCILEHSIYFKYDGIWKIGPSICINDNVFIGSGCEFNITDSIEIGEHSLISSGCRFIDHNHNTDINFLIRSQICREKKITIGKDVWLGCNVIVLQGVKIGDGAVVAAGAVVTKSILTNEVWAGVPARKIGERGNIGKY